MKKKKCPDFELSDLIKYEPDIFISKNHAEQKFNNLILSFSLVFNDLKGLLWVFDQLERGKPEEGLSAYKGQWCGFNSQYKRLVISTLYEFLVVIENNRHIVDDVYFKNLLKKIRPRHRKLWNEIINHTNKQGEQRTHFKNFLRSVRNEAGFHYYEIKNLKKGYNYWRQKKAPETEFAGASLGNNMEKTRFFYADAAIDGYTDTIYKKNNISIKDINKFVKWVNECLRYLIEEFLKPKDTIKN